VFGCREKVGKFEIQISRYSKAPQNNNVTFKIPKLLHFLPITSSFSATKRRATTTTNFQMPHHKIRQEKMRENERKSPRPYLNQREIQNKIFKNKKEGEKSAQAKNEGLLRHFQSANSFFQSVLGLAIPFLALLPLFPFSSSIF
jgi:hypothetical protein